MASLDSENGSGQGNDLHAHFKEEDDVLDAHDSKIVVEPHGERRVNVRLGFLQIRHVYEIRFPVVDDLGEDVKFDNLENLHVKIESATPTEDGQGHNLVVIFNAVKEKLMKETVTMRSSRDNSKTLSMILCARVLGKGKGTPALKTGIHLLRVDGDEESEASDWQGF